VKSWKESRLNYKRRRFAFRPVKVWRLKPGSVLLEDEPIRKVWLRPVTETYTFWCGWVAFESDNSLPTAG